MTDGTRISESRLSATASLRGFSHFILRVCPREKSNLMGTDTGSKYPEAARILPRATAVTSYVVKIEPRKGFNLNRVLGRPIQADWLPCYLLACHLATKSPIGHGNNL